MHFAKLSMVSVNEEKKCLVKSGKDISPSNSYGPKTPLKKYVNINGKVSKDKWQSMFRYLAKYVKTDVTYILFFY